MRCSDALLRFWVVDCVFILRIDGALDEWMPKLFEALESNGLGTGVVDAASTEAIPPPRISIVNKNTPKLRRAVPEKFEPSPDYHPATLRRIERITSVDWSQDVRHIEFEFDENIEFVKGAIR